MNREMQLKLQAYLDGELSARESRHIEQSVARDPQAKALLEELTFTKAFVAANEPQLTLPESREFYWSKIEHAISKAPEQERTTTLAALLWERFLAWRKLLVPIAATALVTVLAVKSIPNGEPPYWPLAEVENLSEHTGSFSFRSHAENMFVVWVYEKPEAAQPAADFDPFDEEELMPE